MSKKIRLNATEDVKEFVKAASKCDFDVDISLMQNLFLESSAWI